jgi:SP family general alpha glucoside:H+ symporter-like MFS transporter
MEMEFAHSVKAPGWMDIFKGSNLRRTEITVMVWLMQQMCGVIFAGNVVYVFEQAGISQQAAFDLGLGTSAIQLFANFLNMWLMYFFGRRTLYLTGFIFSTVDLVVVGVTSILGDRGNVNARWVQAAFQMVGQSQLNMSNKNR